MTVLKKGSKGPHVMEMQAMLLKIGYNLKPDGDFGPATERIVIEFQRKEGLVPDGVAGPKTLDQLSRRANTPAQPARQLHIVDHLLGAGEYYKEIHPKNTIYLHHTAGHPAARSTIQWWASDKNARGGKLAVATAFVIGGKMANNANSDGEVLRAFPEQYWAHHLGCKTANNNRLNQQSIAIEVCNWGPVTKKPNGFFTYVNTPIDAAEVYELPVPFRGARHYHRYTDKQIESLRMLLQDLSRRYGITIKKYWTPAGFELQAEALRGDPGIYTHTNVRADKSDMWPYPPLMDMLNSL